MHLHGHDFWVLAQGYGKWSNQTSSLTLENAPRRDVVMLPASGYVVIAFKTDNPGVGFTLSPKDTTGHNKGHFIYRNTNIIGLLVLVNALSYSMAHVRRLRCSVPRARDRDAKLTRRLGL